MKIICIGRNYANHIKELSNEKPAQPVFFLKPDSAILPKGMPFFIPNFSADIHYEVEVLVKINRAGKHIVPKFAHRHYDEIGLGIDFTARDVQQKCKEKGLPWEKAKAFDGSAVIGDFYPKDNFKDLQNIDFSLYKNEALVQSGNTKNMLWNIDSLIGYVSQFLTLKKGDVFFTGTPAGVGKINIGDVLKGFLKEEKTLELKIK